MDAERIGIGEPSNGGAAQIEFTEPYHVDIRITGTADLLHHRWQVDSVAEKAKAAKGSKAKKTDDVESYVYRNEEGFICLPGEYLRMSIINAAKFHQDPRSPRKSAMDLFRAGLVCVTPLASLGTKDWHYIDRRRVTVQRAGITRHRPAHNAGWSAKFTLLVTVPEYIAPDLLQHVAMRAGMLVGVGDNRPTFGRFHITNFELLKLQ